MRFVNFLFSIPFMVALILFFAIAIGGATFIETAHGAETARAMVYNTWWMTALYILLSINLTANIVRFRLWRKEKWPVLLFHAGFLVILLGAAITRMAGHDYQLHFREGETTDRVLSSHTFLQMDVKQADRTVHAEKKLLLSSVTPNRIHLNAGIDGQSVRLNVKEYLPASMPMLVEDPDGGPVLALSITSGEASEPVFLRAGESQTAHGWTFALDAAVSDSLPTVQIHIANGLLTMMSNRDLTQISMMAGTRETLIPGSSVALTPRTLFIADSLRFALQQFLPAGRIGAVQSDHDGTDETSQPSALIIEAGTGESTREYALFGGPDAEGTPEIFHLSDLEVTLWYGAKSIKLPFSLELTDFIMDRYPGSAMPSGYASEVVVHDPESGDSFPFRIYMNHILKYRGYRFFQSSYDEDEKGSILSVSFDPGTLPTYLGYALVAIALVVNLLNPNSRFRKLGKAVRKRESGMLLILFFAFLIPAFARVGETDDAVLSIQKIDAEHAKAFGRLVVQDARGRMKPVNSLAQEWMRRLGHPEKTIDVSTDRFILAVFVEPGWIESERLFTKGDPRSQDASALLQGADFRFFPLSDAPNQSWHAAGDPVLSTDSVVQDLVQFYREAVLVAIATGDWSGADEVLGRISDYQRQYGAAVMPTDFRIRTEILNNGLQIFHWLGIWLPILGGCMILLIFFHVAFGLVAFRDAIRILSIILLAGFFLETCGLALRWMASGHAPWTNKYESMIFISWAVMLAGVLFARNARLSLGGGALLSGLILTLARTPGFDPKITNLPPVLKSQWLITHVSVITSSYGFFGLGALLGLFILLFFAVSTKRFQEPVRLITDRLSVVIERSLLVGLTLVMIGNFLGAVWANESWGRYWGWDPKETWTLVVILVYTVVLHLRLKPKWGGVYALATGSVLAFLCVMMTYFGVNLYLSGMHSYAGGDRPPIPVGLFIGLGVLIVLIVIAGVRRKRLE